MTTEDDFEPYSDLPEDEAEKRMDVWKKSSRVAGFDDEIRLQENNQKTLIRLLQSAKASGAVYIGKAARASFEVRTSTGINRRETTYFRRGWGAGCAP
jgi:alpha-mannosidase